VARAAQAISHRLAGELTRKNPGKSCSIQSRAVVSESNFPMSSRRPPPPVAPVNRRPNLAPDRSAPPRVMPFNWHPPAVFLLKLDGALVSERQMAALGMIDASMKRGKEETTLR
jgi:hypothetical protein